jgi:SAM-dependent methyltransferase
MNLQLIKYKTKSVLCKLFGKTSYSRVQLNDWLKKIEVKADRVLEVGANFNPVIKKVKKWQVKHYKTLDNNLENNCNPDFNLDLNHLSPKDNAVKRVFRYQPNIIFCLEVMEYIYKPNMVLKFFYDVLAPEGILYISFHTIYPVHQPYKYDSLRYTKWGIINLLKDAGFSKWEIAPRVATQGLKELKTFYKKEKMFALKKSNLPYDIGYFVKAKRL